MGMGEDLVSLQDFAIRMDATLEQVMDSGQKIEFGGTAIYRVSRPDRLRLDIDTDTGGTPDILRRQDCHGLHAA